MNLRKISPRSKKKPEITALQFVAFVKKHVTERDEKDKPVQKTLWQNILSFPQTFVSFVKEMFFGEDQSSKVVAGDTANSKVTKDEKNLPALKEGWQDVMAAVRTDMQEIWGKMPEDQRAEFYKEFLPWWRPLRNRIDPEIDKRLKELQSDGVLELSPGRIKEANIAADNKLNLEIFKREESAGPRPLRPNFNEGTMNGVDYVINCTGPDRDIVRSNPFLKKLNEKFMLQRGPADAGVRLDGERAKGISKRIFPLSGELLIGELFEINGWQDLKKWVEKTGEKLKSFFGLAVLDIEKEKNAVENEVAAIFKRHEGFLDTVIEEQAARSPSFLDEMAEKNPELFKKIRDLRSATPGITPAQLVTEIKREMPEKGFWQMFQELKAEYRPKLDTEGLARLDEQRRAVMGAVHMELPEILRRHPNFLKQEYLQPENPDSPRGYGNNVVINNKENHFFAKAFAFVAGKRTPLHDHKARCISVVISGEVFEVIYEDANNPNSPVIALPNVEGSPANLNYRVKRAGESSPCGHTPVEIGGGYRLAQTRVAKADTRLVTGANRGQIA